MFCGKFCKILRVSLQNSAAYHDKIIQILRLTVTFHFWVNWALSCSETCFWSAGWHSNIVLNYGNNVRRKSPIFLVLEVQFVKLRCVYFIYLVYLWLCHIAIAISRTHSFLAVQFDFFVTKIRHQVKNGTNCQWIFNFCRIPRNSAEISKFRGREKIPRLGSKFRGPRNTGGPANNNSACECRYRQRRRASHGVLSFPRHVTTFRTWHQHLNCLVLRVHHILTRRLVQMLQQTAEAEVRWHPLEASLQQLTAALKSPSASHGLL